MQYRYYGNPSSGYAKLALGEIESNPLPSAVSHVESDALTVDHDARATAHHRLPGTAQGHPLARSVSGNLVARWSPAELYPMAKRSMDVVVSLIALLLLAPLCVLIAVLIRAEDGGVIFYTHSRVGQDGCLFHFYKFRSMVENADALKEKLSDLNEATGPVFKMRDDPRITCIGRVLRKTSLDELPQFWNVLRGDMSLVGPRPHLPKEVAMYTEEQKARLSVPPGLICLREVTGRSNLTFDRWIETDLLYVRTRSLSTDLKILWRAVPAILKGEGAY